MWGGNAVEPDWAALFPIPAIHLVDGDAGFHEDLDDDYDDGFWLSPRMACRLHHAGTIYVDVVCEDWSGMAIREMPPVVQPYAQHEQWMDAYREAAMRLVKRLEKGLEPQPNCTAEEFALHKIIDHAKDDWESGDEAQEDSLEGLPCSTMDEDFDAVSEAAFQDEDVLMLFDMPQLIHPSAVTQQMDIGNLHPEDWFKPFQPELVSNHV